MENNEEEDEKWKIVENSKEDDTKWKIVGNNKEYVTVRQESEKNEGRIAL